MLITIPDEVPMSWNTFYSGGKGATWKRKAEKDRVQLLMLAYVPHDAEPFNVPVDITITAYRPTRRRCDADNVCDKFYIDALKPRIIKEDDWEHVASAKTAVRYDKENPRLEIKIVEATS